MYSFYVIHAGIVTVGFDNYPDRQALYAKYRETFASHLNELIPHKHASGKETLELTETITVAAFLNYLRQEMPLD